MQSHYEINVALNGRHFFATAERSAVNPHQYNLLLTVLQQKFPASEGFSITAAYYECVGHTQSIDPARIVSPEALAAILK